MRKPSKKRTRARRATGKEFRAFMEANGLRTPAGDQLVASWLYTKINTVQHHYSRGILRTELDLLGFKVAEMKKAPHPVEPVSENTTAIVELL